MALVSGVDQGLALALYDRGIDTVQALVRRVDESTLAAIKRPWGQRMRVVGNDAGKILRMARALNTGQEVLIARPEVPTSPNYAMFDLPGYIRARLERADIQSIEDLELCTYADPARFFSYRRTTHRGEPDYGRHVNAIALAE